MVSSCYLDLEKENEKMKKLLYSMQPNRGTNVVTQFRKDSYSANNEDMYGNISYQNSKSLVENSIARCSSEGKHNRDSGSFIRIDTSSNIKTRRQTVLGLQHPYDKVRDILSKFP